MQTTEPLTRAFFEQPALVCAREMLGCTLTWGETAGIIVETEAYAEHGDAASHAFVRGATRSFIHEQPPGALYIYLNYGVHWLLNFLTKAGDTRGFVLIRALQPVAGLELMRQRRRLDRERMLWAGEAAPGAGHHGAMARKRFFLCSGCVTDQEREPARYCGRPKSRNHKI